MHLLTHDIHVAVGGVGGEGVHLLVGLVGREVAVDHAVDEVDLHVGIGVGVGHVVIDDVGQGVVGLAVGILVGDGLLGVVLDDVEAVLQGEGGHLRVATVEVATDVAVVPGDEAELEALLSGQAAHHDGVRAGAVGDAGDAGVLVVEFTGAVPQAGQRVDVEQAGEGGHAVVGGVLAVEDLRGEALDEGILDAVDVVGGDALAELGIDVVGKDAELADALGALAELHLGAGGEFALTCEHFKLHCGGVGQTALAKVDGLGAGTKAPVVIVIEAEVGITLLLDIDLDVAEVAVAIAILTGHVVDIVDTVHVGEGVGEDGGVGLGDNELVRAVGRVPEGGGVAVEGVGGRAVVGARGVGVVGGAGGLHLDVRGDAEG